MIIEQAYADANNNDTIAVTESESLPTAPEQIQSGWTSIIPMVLIFVVLYFFLIRPQEKRRRQQEELINSVKEGEKVITTGGIFGVVKKIIDDNSIEVEIGKNVEIKILKSAIAEITSRKTETKTEGDSKQSKKSSIKKNVKKSA